MWECTENTPIPVVWIWMPLLPSDYVPTEIIERIAYVYRMCWYDRMLESEKSTKSRTIWSMCALKFQSVLRTNALTLIMKFAINLDRRHAFPDHVKYQAVAQKDLHNATVQQHLSHSLIGTVAILCRRFFSSYRIVLQFYDKRKMMRQYSWTSIMNYANTGQLQIGQIGQVHFLFLYFFIFNILIFNLLFFYCIYKFNNK